MVALGSFPDTIPQSFIILHLHYLVSPKATVGEGQCLLPPMLLNMYNLLLYYTEFWFWSNILACLYIRNIHNIISILFPVYILRTPFSFQNTDAVKKSFMVFCICTMEHLLWNATDFSFTPPEIHTSKTPPLSTFSQFYCTPTTCAASATKYKTQLYCAQHQQQNSNKTACSHHHQNTSSSWLRFPPWSKQLLFFISLFARPFSFRLQPPKVHTCPDKMMVQIFG